MKQSQVVTLGLLFSFFVNTDLSRVNLYCSITSNESRNCLLLSWVFFATSVKAGKNAKFQLYGDITYFYTCNLQISLSVSYCATPYNATCLCANKNALATYAGCLAFDNRNTTTAVNYMMNYCEENGNVTVEKDWYEKSYHNFLSMPKLKKKSPISIKLSPLMCHSNLMKLK